MPIIYDFVYSVVHLLSYSTYPSRHEFVLSFVNSENVRVHLCKLSTTLFNLLFIYKMSSSLYHFYPTPRILAINEFVLSFLRLESVSSHLLSPMYEFLLSSVHL